MTLAEVIPLFPPGVHDIETVEADGLTTYRCAMGDWTIDVRSLLPSVHRWVRLSAYDHAARHRRVPCHQECVEEPDCLYDGEVG